MKALTLVVFILVALLCDQANATSFIYDCSFNMYSNQKSHGTEESPPFKLIYSYDDSTGKAIAKGNATTISVLVHKGADAITFIEPLDSGAIQSTTITTDNKAVHSRHSIIVTMFNPHQMYGSCDVGQVK